MEEGEGAPDIGFDEAVIGALERIQAMQEQNGKDGHISLVINHIGTVGNLFQSVGPNARSSRTIHNRTESQTLGLVSTASQTEDIENDLDSGMREAEQAEENGTEDDNVDAAASKATPNSNPDGITADGVGSAFRDSPSRQSPDAAALQAASSSAEQGTRQDKSSAKKKVQSMIVPGAGAVILWKEKRGMNRPNSAGSEQIPEGENTPVSSGPGASNENGGGHVSKIAVGRKRRRNEVPERVLKEIEGNVEVNLQGVPSSKKGETCQVEAQASPFSATATVAALTSPSKRPNTSAGAVPAKSAGAASQPVPLVPGAASVPVESESPAQEGERNGACA